LLIAAAIVAIIIYGSLYPFAFHPGPAPQAAFDALLYTWRQPTSRGDIISNILLYMPLGLFGANAFGRVPYLLRVILVTLLGLGLCVTIEIAQFYESARSSMMFDVYTNTGGTLLGAVFSFIFRPGKRLPIVGQVEWNPFAALLLVSWVGYRLFPYVPVIDLHKYWDAVKPLVFDPVIVPLDIFRHTAIWLVLAVVLEGLFGPERRRLFFLFIPTMLLARVLIHGIVLTPAEAIGGGLAFALWIVALSHLPLPGRAGIAALLMIAVIVIQSLAPYAFLATPRPFGWIPFLSFMQGSIEVNVRSMCEKVFTYGSLLWLLTRTGFNLPVATALAGATVFALRYAQTYLPDRSAEITDFIMVVIMAIVLKLLAEAPAMRQPRPVVSRA
jgi:VanZ family protein